MMTENLSGDPFSILRWQRAKVKTFAGMAFGAWVAVTFLGMSFLQLPVMPITVVGAAVGIFASFRANQAYDRWWEGRKLWGRLINSSRHWCSQVTHYIQDTQTAERLVLRHVTYVHALRTLLRKEDPYKDESYNRHMTDEITALEGSTNLTHALLDLQMRDLVALADAGMLDAHRLESMDRTLQDLLNIQGGCERIKGTPLPRGYGFIVEQLILLFAFMLPFALIRDIGILTVPMNVMVCLSFALISEAGRVLEDPFSLFFNGLPLNALSIKIERNLRERLGHKSLPKPVTESPPGVLM